MVGSSLARPASPRSLASRLGLRSRVRWRVYHTLRLDVHLQGPIFYGMVLVQSLNSCELKQVL
jgi:hypothetical protein